jgi:hypothetical protein
MQEGRRLEMMEILILPNIMDSQYLKRNFDPAIKAILVLISLCHSMVEYFEQSFAVGVLGADQQL